MASGSGSLYGTIGRSTNPDDIQFILYYDPRIKDVSMELTYNDKRSVRSSPFNNAKATKVLIHGLMANTLDDFPRLVKDAYLDNQNRNDANIIVVDWSQLAGQNQAMWFDVLKRVETAGRRLSDFLLWLHTALSLDLRRNFHLVGHRFGAHLTGMVGNHVVQNKNLIGRISALDPKDPGYFADDHSRRLEKNDAAFVDVYHTNVNKMEESHMLGHVDFFVNTSTATPFVTPDKTTNEDKNSIAHRMFAQTIIDGPYGNNVTSQIHGVNSNSVYGYPQQIIVGEYCIPGTNGWFDISY